MHALTNQLLTVSSKEPVPNPRLISIWLMADTLPPILVKRTIRFNRGFLQGKTLLLLLLLLIVALVQLQLTFKVISLSLIQNFFVGYR